MGCRCRQWIRRCLELALLFCLILPGLRGLTLASNDTADVKDEKLHYIVRHWYADGTHTDDEGYLVEGDPTVTIHVKKRDGETFSGFATAAGHEAVDRERDEEEPDNSVLKISYQKDIHLAKVHAFYKNSNLEKVGADLGGSETKEGKDGIKRYNTSKEGLHTDKTAKGDGRQFELSLESWYVEDNRSDVGMVLDASGSMAFTSNDLEPMRMTDAQIAKYGKMKYIPQNEVNKILNPFYTDNSKLAYSGYTYFVYDPSADTKEYVPIGYWNGTAKTISPDKTVPRKGRLAGYYPFNDGNTNKVGDFSETAENDPASKELKVVAVKKETGKLDEKIYGTPLHTRDKNTAYNYVGKSLDLVRTYREKSQGAVLMDIKPEGKSFTISFAVRGSSDRPVVWIGSRDQSSTGSQAWYAVYADTRSAKTKVSSGIGIPTAGNDLDNDAEKTRSVTAELSKGRDWIICTYVFSENTDTGDMTVSIFEGKDKKAEGTVHGGVLSSGAEDMAVLLGGSVWQEDYGNGGKWETDNRDALFLMDELYFYNDALSKEDVSGIYERTLKAVDAKTFYAATAPSDEEKTIAKLQNADASGNGAGWYLVSSDSNWSDSINEKLLTAKRYQGIPGDEVIYNRMEEWPEGTKDPRSANTDEYIYTGDKDLFKGNEGDRPAIGKDAADSWNGSVIFYIDREGFLRCFYNTGRNQKRGEEKDGIINTSGAGWTQNDSHCSYVYKKEDLMRIKTEALQRALGSFVTRLSEVSPKSRVAAVRFSTDNIRNLDRLVLQNWTANTMDSTGMLGLRRGERTILDYETESGVNQYNYALTGGTTTRAGLKSYMENLDIHLDDQDSVDNNLIIFTDGKDNTDKEGALALTEQLKKKGYKIYCVMLQSAGNQKEAAKPFLNALASEEDDVFYANDVEDLTEVFTREILNRIVNNLPGYTIQDYIDPRFDLVDADGRTIHLNAGGTIQVKGTEKKIDDKSGFKVCTTKKKGEDAAGTVGEEALLFYDSVRDMYYLQWRGQTIPGCSTGAERLNVWKTRITVRAKEDFIGGNAVISNGNDSGMNLVFHPDDRDSSSGEGDTLCSKDKETGRILNYPSRGFPRTSVHVELLKLKLENGYRKIYMGQNIVPEDALAELSGRVREKVYYEYLERYINWNILQKREEGRDLPEQLRQGRRIQIPYYYLPDTAGSNQAGRVQQAEQIGWLAYGWTECDVNGVPKNKGIYAPYETTDTTSRYYQLSVSYLPMSVEERRKETAGILTDPDYASPKAPVGTEQKTEVRGLGMHQTDIVRGEIIVEARVLLSDLKYLVKKNGGKLRLNESFSVVRTYNGKESRSGLKLPFSFTTKQLKALRADSGGYVSVFSAPSAALPLGKYTIKVENKTPFRFGTIRTRKIADGNRHFSLDYTKEGKEGRYAAPAEMDEKNNTAVFYLGVASSGNETKVDLDAQLGHAAVTYQALDIPAPPAPKAKKNGSEDPSKTKLDDNLPKGRAYADRKRRAGENAPDTGDRAEPVHVLVLLASSALLILLLARRRYQTR